LTKIIDSEKIRKLNVELFRNIYYTRNWDDTGISKWTNKFPGSESVNLSKRDFDFLRRTKYWVCEKSDGIRALVMVLSDGMYICDRKSNWFFLESEKLFLPSSKKPSENQHLTIFDCEVTYNYHFQKYCLMIFDILYIEGKRVMDLKLSDRLHIIRDKIIAPFRHTYSEQKQLLLPFVLLGKEYLEIHKINDVLSKIKEYKDPNEPSGYRYLYENGKRFNDNDGLIFTSDDKCYKPNRCISLKRWKWPVFNTVDFLAKVSTEENQEEDTTNEGDLLIKEPKPKFTLYYQYYDSTIKYREVYFEKQNSEKLINDLNGATEAIIECRYDSEIGEWAYHKIRYDKSYPNNFSSILQVMEIIFENISKEEIIEKFGYNENNNLKSTKNEENNLENINSVSNSSDDKENDIVFESPLKQNEDETNNNSLIVFGTKRKIGNGYDIEESIENTKKSRKKQLYKRTK